MGLYFEREAECDEGIYEQDTGIASMFGANVRTLLWLELLM